MEIHFLSVMGFLRLNLLEREKNQGGGGGGGVVEGLQYGTGGDACHIAWSCKSLRVAIVLDTKSCRNVEVEIQFFLQFGIL